MGEEVLVKYPDGTALKFVRRGATLYLDALTHSIGKYEAPDEQRASEILLRMDKGDETLIQRIFEELEWLPGYTVDDIIQNIRAVLEQQDTDSIIHPLEDCTPEVIRETVSRIKDDDQLMIQQKPTLSNPSIKLTEA